MKTHSTIVNAVFGSLVFLVMMFAPGEGWGQQVIGAFPYMNGGFEGQTVAALGTTLSSTAWTRQSQSGASSSIITSSPRSGSQCATVTNVSTVSRGLQSPQLTPFVGSSAPLASTAYVVQFYVKNSATVASFQGGVTTNGTSNPAYSTAATLAINGSWTKQTFLLTTSSTAVTSSGLAIAGRSSTGTFDVDDVVIYAGSSADVTAPSSPGAVTVDGATQTSLNVSWGAASGGVDGGGYVVVRYATIPNADNDPNQNGIYAVGNTTTNGTGSLTGTIRYIGTSLSFTDNVGLSEGTQYWYKVYTVDKAFNYSAESSGNGSTTSGTTPTKLVITSVLPASPASGSTFSVTVQAQDASNNPANVTSATGISLTKATGTGTLGGTTTGTILIGTSSITISGVTYDTPETGVSLTASPTGGMTGLTPGTSSTFTVLASLPTAASAVNVTGRSLNSISISWTNGTGSGRIVVARLFATAVVAPSSGKSYTPNSTSFTDGLNPTTGDNNFVVYNGTGNSLIITGLTAATAYDFDVYEYNGATAAVTNYAAAASAGSTSTLATEPATPSAITIGTPTATSLVINTSGGDGTGRIIVVRQTGAVDFVPVDETAYTPNTVFTDGTGVGPSSDNKVVYANTGNTVTVTGLTANTMYYVAVFDYNGSSTTINYLTSSFGTASRATLANAPGVATNLTFSSVAYNSFNASFTAPVTAPTGYLVLRNTGSAVTGTPVGGTVYTEGQTNIGAGTNQVVYVGTSVWNNTPSTGLTDNTTYHFAVYSYNGASESTAYSATALTNSQATTAVPAPNATAAQGVGRTGFTAHWDASDGAASYRLDVSTSATFGTGVNPTDLFISEYVEGSSSNKYIEIFNGTGSAVDLSNYKLQLYSNGASSPSSDMTLSGTLNNGNTIVYKNSAATIYLGTSTSNAAVNFNGDDAVALYKISSSSYVDIIGRIGEDPGTAWTSGSFTTLDKTLVRKSTITGGVTTNPASGFPTLATEWDQYDIDVVTNLGSHTFNGLTPSYVSGYENLTVNATSQAVSGLTPVTGYYYRVRAVGTNSTSANSNVITTSTGISYLSQSNGGYWNAPATWNPTGTPTAIDDVTIKTAFPVIVDAANTTPATCANLAIETGTSLTIDPNKALTVSLGLSNVDGTTGLIVKSDINGTGSLIHSTTNINGTFERYMNDADWTNWQDGWHFLSSPVATQAISPNFTTTDPDPPYDFYCWYEPSNLWVNYKNRTGEVGATAPFFDVVNGSVNFTVGRGYLAEYDVAATKSFSGVLNVTNVSVSNLTITGSSQFNRSWHMLGNPFGSAITWDASPAWGFTNIAGVAQIWDEASQDYLPLTSNPPSVIPATNGFMVQVSEGTGSLTIPAASRTHSAQPFYKSTIPGVKLTARNISAGNAKESSVYFNPEATTGFDLMLDGEFLHGYGPSFFSTSGEVKLSINSLPDLSAQTSIPFTFIPNEGTSFKIEASGLESVFAQAWLLDKKTNTDHNLSLNPAYSFTSSSSDNPDRFVLHFSGVGMGETTIAETISVYNAGNTINISSKTGASLTGNVYVYNMIGQLIHSQTLSGGNLTKITLNTLTGYYLVKVVTADHTISTKVFFN